MDSSHITCIQCGNVSPMKQIGKGEDMVTYEDERIGPYETGRVFEILKCPKCGQITLADYEWNSAMDSEDFTGYRILYPVKESFPLGLPVKILNEYVAAEQVKQVHKEAYALILGRILEMICIDYEASGKTLADRLQDLSLKNKIPEKLVKVASSLRMFRNRGAHVGEELDSKQLPLIRALCNALLQYLYTAPYLADLAEKQLKKKPTK